jgi:hypothetical protein
VVNKVESDGGYAGDAPNETSTNERRENVRRAKMGLENSRNHKMRESLSFG